MDICRQGDLGPRGVMVRLGRVSPMLLASWFVVAVFVGSRVPLMSRSIRHGWYEDMNAQHNVLVMARAFVQEGGRTPYLLFPRWSARVDQDEPWLLYTSFPPLPYYLLTPIVALGRDPYVQIFFARLLATLIMAVGSWLVFRLFQRIAQDDSLALIAQVVSTFSLDRYYFADLPFGSQYGYTLGLIQILLVLAIVDGVPSRKQIWSAHLVSAAGALTWLLNSFIPPTALALSYVFKAPREARRALWGVALSSTFATLAVFSWLAVAELSTSGIRAGSGTIGAGLLGFVNFFQNQIAFVRFISPVNAVQTYLEFFLRFILPPFPALVADLSVGQQMMVMGLLPRRAFTIDQLITLPLAVLLFSLFGLLAVRGTRGWLARCSTVERPRISGFALLLFTLPGFIFVALLHSWAYNHHPYGRMAITPIGVVLAVGAYCEVRRLIPRNRTVLLAGWLTLWATLGVSMTYSMVKTFDDSYNRAELAALNWFRQHVPPGSVLINNIPAFDDLYSTFDIFYSDARTYYKPYYSNTGTFQHWAPWVRQLAAPNGFIGLPGPHETLPYFERVLSALDSLEGGTQRDTIHQMRARIQVLKEAIGRSGGRPDTERERLRLLDYYGEVFAYLRSVNRELGARGLPRIPLPLPPNWGRHDNYLLLREDFGLPPLFRGINYFVVFESEYSTAPDAFLGGRTAYNLICRENVQGRWVPIRCWRAARRALAAGLQGDWQAVRSLSFITARPSQDNFEFPIRGDAKPAGKIRLLKLEGE